jgi:hypothetical protein
MMREMMREMMRKIMGVAFVAIFIVTLISYGGYAKAETKAHTCSSDLAFFCKQGYNGGIKGPITMVNAVLKTNGISIPVYLIGLSGTELVDNQATGIFTDLKVGFELENPYIYAVVRALTENVPKDSNLVFCGHSLGGMIAQQAAANYILKRKYNILNVVTFGSPLISPGQREGTVKRLGDTSDVVPYLSSSGTFLLPWQVFGLNREDGGYNGRLKTAHSESYLRSDVWGAYDVLGQKGGRSTLTYDIDQTQYYYAPTDGEYYY